MKNQQPATGFSVSKTWQKALAFAALAGSFLVQPAFAGPITNAVTVSGTTLGKPITATTSVDVTLAEPAPQLSLEKIATVHGAADGSVKPGDSITYTFVVTNSGNVTLNHIQLTDLDANLTGTEIATLAPGQSNTTAFSAVHLLTANDIKGVVYTNIANATAAVGTKTGGTVKATAKAKSLLNIKSDLSFGETAQLDMGSNGRVDAGDVVTYTFHVTNTGNSDLHNVVVSSPMLNMAMLPGQERTIALLSGANEPSDQFATASIIPDAQDPANLKSDSEDQTVSSASVPQLPAELRASRQLVNMGGSQKPLEAGDKIGFVYTLYNTGEVPLLAIDVRQPDGFAFGSKLDVLNPGQADAASVIFTREITADEVARGTVQSPATIIAKSRGQTYTWDVADALPVSSARAFDSFTTASISPASLL
jgi:uncharacterized repeat protein (TIGR01451 family)